MTVTDKHEYYEQVFDAETRKPVGLPHDAESAGAGGVAVVSHLDWKCPDLHREVLQRSGQKQVKPVNPQEFIPLLEAMWNQDVAKARAYARTVNQDEIDQAAFARKGTERQFIEKYLKAKRCTDDLREQLQLRGLCGLTIHVEGIEGDPEEALNDPGLAEAYTALVEGKRPTVAEIENALVAQARNCYSEEFDWLRNLKDISIEDLRNRMDFNGVTLRASEIDPQKRELVIHFDPDFDSEHGMHLCIRRREIEFTDY